MIVEAYPGSPLTQGRGSKQPARIGAAAAVVAPHAGAWIETRWSRRRARPPGSPLTQGRGSKRRSRLVEAVATRRRPSRRGVDRNQHRAHKVVILPRRPSRRGVDRNVVLGPAGPAQSVAPHAGAWIETRRTAAPRPRLQRRPSRRGVDRNERAPDERLGALVAPHAGAWIETGAASTATAAAAVAPHAGAWIETTETRRAVPAAAVAPHAGAWIETLATRKRRIQCSCRPSRRGVDRNCLSGDLAGRYARSPLTQGRGSKLFAARQQRQPKTSPLTQGRGSKPARTGLPQTRLPSPLTQGRGSKLAIGGIARHGPCRPSRRGVDRNRFSESK